MIACADCGGQLVAVPAPPGSLGVVWGHAIPAPDRHDPAVPPVTVTYWEQDGMWCAESAEVPGFPVLGVASMADVKTVAWALLGKLSPTRPVIEQTRTAGGSSA